MQDANTHRVPEDEIDFSRIAHKIARAVSYPFRLFNRNKLTTLLFLLTAVVLAVTGKYVLAKEYRSTFIIRPLDRNERFHLKMLGDIERLLKMSDAASVGRLLNLTPEQLKHLTGIKSHNPFLSNRSDSINYTEVRISSSDPRYLPALQKGILYYLENNPYFAKIRRLQEAQRKEQMAMVERDLLMLDSLKTLQLRQQQLQAGNRIILAEDLFDPSRLYTAANERMTKKMALMAQETFLDNFQLVKGITPAKHHSFPPRILVMCLYFVPVALIFCFIFLAIKENISTKKN